MTHPNHTDTDHDGTQVLDREGTQDYVSTTGVLVPTTRAIRDRYPWWKHNVVFSIAYVDKEGRPQTFMAAYPFEGNEGIDPLAETLNFAGYMVDLGLQLVVFDADAKRYIKADGIVRDS